MEDEGNGPENKNCLGRNLKERLTSDEKSLFFLNKLKDLYIHFQQKPMALHKDKCLKMGFF